MRIKVCMSIAIACLAAASPVPAQYCELETLNFHSEGDGVSADFSSVDTSTCALGIETAVHVESSQGVITLADTCGSGGGSTTTVTTTESNIVAVLVGVYDRCLAAQVLSVTGAGQAADLHMNPNFKTASLRAAFEGTDDSGQAVSIAIDLVWTGVGDKERQRDHVTDSQGGIVRFRYTSSGIMRDAVAAGSVTVNGTDETPLPSNQGTMEKAASREFTQYR